MPDNRQNKLLTCGRLCESHVHEWPLAYDTEHKTFEKMKGICKAQRMKERQLRGKGNHLTFNDERLAIRESGRRRPAKPIWYKVDPENPRQIILKNGTRLRQPMVGVGLFCTEGGRFYSLTRYGLRPIKVQLSPKNNYCKKIMTGRGHHQGQHYPHVAYGRRFRYPAHHLMILAWQAPWDKSIEEVDHIDGNINKFSLDNLEIVTKEENIRRRKILYALRKASKQFKDPSLNPKNMSPEELRRIFREIDCDDAAKIIERERRYHREV